MKKRWTQEEDDLLRKWWQTKRKLVHIADLFPGRNAESMMERARRIGLGDRKNVSRGGGSWLLIERELKAGPKTALQIAAKTGLKPARVMEVIRTYRENVYISDWTNPVLGGRARIFSLGRKQKDKPRPPKLSRQEINREYMRRTRAERPELSNKWQQAHSQRKRDAKGAKADPAASWLNNNAETIRADEAHAVQETSQEEASLAQQDGAGRLPGASVFPVYSGSLLRGYSNGSAGASQ